MGFLYINSKENFETLLNAGMVDYLTIAFVGDSGQIWTHDKWFCGDSLTREDVQKMIDENIIEVLNQEI